jgi:hypothetical protein
MTLKAKGITLFSSSSHLLKLSISFLFCSLLKSEEDERRQMNEYKDNDKEDSSLNLLNNVSVTRM